MRSFILATALVTCAVLAGSSARADIEYPYCSTGGWVSGGCNYATLQQCQAFNQGVGGWCVPNPRYTQQRENAAAGPRRTQRH